MAVGVSEVGEASFGIGGSPENATDFGKAD